MNQKQYTDKLNKLLKGIDKQTREDIILEIKAPSVNLTLKFPLKSILDHLLNLPNNI